jgi:hypothetical protein
MTKHFIPKQNDLTTKGRLLGTPFQADTDFHQCKRNRRGHGETPGQYLSPRHRK